MLVGEQPGDQEDKQGAPFVGPAGRVLDRALAAAGIPREQAYVTNAVKHFKWKERGPRRIHDKPSWTEQMACLPWLEAELALVRPRALVLLGATAAQSLLGRGFRVTQSRGRPLESDLAELVLATIHPSAVLRAEDQDAAFAGLVGDLRPVRGFAA
jgi:DNA polymerase